VAVCRGGRYFYFRANYYRNIFDLVAVVRPVYQFRKIVLLLRIIFLILTGTEILHGGYLATKYLVIKNKPLPPSVLRKLNH